MASEKKIVSNSKKPVAEYLRKSRYDDPHATVEGVLQKHKELLEEYKTKNGITVASKDLYEEVVSGDSLYARPQMLRLLEAVEQGKYSAVLCMDLQRLGRGSMKDQGVILDAFKHSGTRIITPGKTYDLDDEIDETYTEFETFMGRQELRMIKKRLQRGKDKTIQDGGFCANAPYGYERIYINKKPSLKIVEEEAKFVRIMFDCYANKEMGGQQIAAYVSSLGATPHRGSQFARTSVLKILRNPVYIGKIVWNRQSYIPKGVKGNDKKITISKPEEEWIYVQGMHPPVIEESLFDKVQERLKVRRHLPSYTGVIENPLAGLVFCRNCGSTMQRQGCKGGPVLLCLTKACVVSSRLEYIEQVLLSQLAQEAQLLEATLMSKQQPIEEQSVALEELLAVETELKKSQNQIGKLHDLVEQQVYDIPTFVARRDELELRIKELQKVRERLLINKGKQKNTQQILECILRVLKLYSSSSPDEKNRLLKGILQRVTYTKEKGALPKEFKLVIEIRQYF